MTFYSLIETQFHTKIKTIRSDNGAEFRMTDFFQAKASSTKGVVSTHPNKMAGSSENINT